MKESATSLAGLKGRKGVLITLIAVILVPLIYAAIILTPSWGPYDNLSNLPVAVVNEDEGAMSGEDPINVGEDLVADLKENKTLGWEFVNAREAQRGLDNLKYYMVIEIPKDFSQNVTTVLSANPKIPELKYTKNEGLHFMASQVTNSATERIREQLANKITETYAKNMFAQLEQIAVGFQDGADGSTKLNEGAVKLQDGTGTILESLESKSDDINKLASGTQELKNGVGTLFQKIQGGSGDVNKLAAGAKAVSTGAKDLQNGSNQILDGLKVAQAGSSKINDGLQQLAPGSKALADGVTAAAQGIAPLAAGSAQVADGVEQMSKHPLLGPLLATNKDFQTLLAGSRAVSNGMQTLHAKAPALQAGANKIAGGLAQAAPGSQALKNGLDKLIVGQKQVVQGSTKLADGASQVANGNASLNGSWGQLSAGAQKLNAGAGQINDGNQTVKIGWSTLTDGVKQVDDGIGQIEGGTKELASGLIGGAEKVNAINVSDQNISQFASPVELTGSTINEFPMYRYANAPYILSLALFVGVLVLSLLFDIRRPEDVTVSSTKWYISIFSKMAGLAGLQAIIMSVFALFFIKTSMANGILLIVFSIIASITFLAIIFFLVALAGNIGRFISVIFLVLQLSTTGSSLPIEMLPENLRTLSNFLPMRYSIDSFRSLISLDNMGSAWSNITTLFIYLIVAVVLIALVALLHSRKTSHQSTIEA